MDESLPIMLRQLRLPAFTDHHQLAAQMGTEKAWDYAQYLGYLCEHEIARRYGPGVGRRNCQQARALPP